MVASDPPSPDRLVTLLERGDFDDARVVLDALRTAPVDARKSTLRSLRTLADDAPDALEPVLPAIATFLEDDDRAIRLTTAKLFVALAEERPTLVVPHATAVADRLSDEDEFYFVRARAAEALGYAAAARPDAVASPELLADLRVGLAFDEPEVTEKLAKALEHVALGNPGRLRHHVETLADHLDDDAVVVRYHLTTALAVVGCDSPDALGDAIPALVERLDDENQYVRGRAVEALGLAFETADVPADAATDSLTDLLDDEPFVAKRARVAVAAAEGADLEDPPDGVGSVDGIADRTDELSTEIARPEGDGECPNCGLELPGDGPPMCPRCGGPY